MRYRTFTDSMEVEIRAMSLRLEATLLLNPCMLYNAVDAS